VAEVDGSNWDSSGRVASLVEMSMRGWDNRPARNTTAAMLAAVMSSPALRRLSMAFINGDISYARGFGAIWQAWLAAMQPIASRIPLMTSIGNHEANWPGVGDAWNTSSLDSGGEGGVPYAHFFPMPKTSGSTTPWYSLDLGPVHVVVLSSEHDVSSPTSTQVQWLAADLESAHSSGASAPAWTVVLAHRFFYIDSSNPDGDGAAGATLRAHLEPLFVRHRVAFTFTGHHHSYQRTHPLLINGTLAPTRSSSNGHTICSDGVVHVVGGHAGAGLHSRSTGRPDVRRLFATPRGLPAHHGFLRVIANESAITVEAVRSSDGEVVDTVTR
jgi:hypothetical protein